MGWKALIVALAAAYPAATAPANQDANAPQEKPRYANPELLVETGWLAEHGADAGVRIVDARKASAYRAGHVPGAISIPRSETFDPDGPRDSVGRPEEIAKLFGAKGIDRKVHVVVYDEGKSTAAARVFWTLEYYGHPRVSVLNGGLAKWKAEERELSKDEPRVTPVELEVRETPERLATMKGMLADLDDAGAVMLDVRSIGEFTGEKAWSDRGGRVPGAVHIEWTRNFTAGKAPVFKPPAELAKLYEAAGVTRKKRIHAY